MSSPRVPLGSVTVICGSMFSGKTEELIRLVRRAMHARKRVQVFKSSLDTRCDTTVIRTHDDTRFNAIAVPDSRTLESLLEPGVQVIGIEEVQFLDEGIVELCGRLADQGLHVIVAGLDQDFRALPFSFMPRLMALADNVMKLHAICKVCGEEASRTQRLVNGRAASWDEPTILIGADDTYEARCRRCHQVRNIPKQFRKQFSAFPPEGGSGTGKKEIRSQSRLTARSQNGNGSTHHQEVSYTLPGAASTPSSMDDGSQLEMFPEITAHRPYPDPEDSH